MNVLVAKATLEREAARLRQIADELRPCAPAIALRVDSLARECDVKRDRLGAAEILTSIEFNPRRDFGK